MSNKYISVEDFEKQSRPDSPCHEQFEIFKSNYNDLRSKDPQTFDTKVFAEHVRFEGKKMMITDS